MILLITRSSIEPTLFHAGCRPSLHVGLYRQSQPFFMLDVSSQRKPFFMLDVSSQSQGLFHTGCGIYTEPVLFHIQCVIMEPVLFHTGCGIITEPILFHTGCVIISSILPWKEPTFVIMSERHSSYI